jgi:hypothetical protein
MKQTNFFPLFRKNIPRNLPLDFVKIPSKLIFVCHKNVSQNVSPKIGSTVAPVPSPWYVNGSRMVKGNFYLAIFYLIKMKFSQRYIADMLGVACNLRLPKAKGSKG